jgi:hypothetical protein
MFLRVRLNQLCPLPEGDTAPETKNDMKQATTKYRDPSPFDCAQGQDDDVNKQQQKSVSLSGVRFVIPTSYKLLGVHFVLLLMAISFVVERVQTQIPFGNDNKRESDSTPAAALL